MSAEPEPEPEPEPGPRLSEPLRRERAATSARSLLLTLLGEFVLPRHEPVWTASLVAALGVIEVEEKAARQALARTAAEGVIEADRVGRRTRWLLAPRGARLLAEGRDRIYGFMRDQQPWDGRWLVLTVTVPETRRRTRHQLRTRLTWAGLGSPAPGLWVVPDAGRLDEVAAIVAELGIQGQAMSWIGPSGSIGDPLALVAHAWSLGEVEQTYAEFVAQFAGRAVTGQAEAFVAQVDLVQAWRRFPFLDPALPPELLDHDWPGPRAAKVFHGCHDRWHEGAQAYWDAGFGT